MNRGNRNQHADEPQESLISQGKAAEMCGLTREMIGRLIRKGQLRAMEVNGQEMVYREEVEVLARHASLERESRA